MLRIMEDALIGGQQLRMLVQTTPRTGIAGESRMGSRRHLHPQPMAARETIRRRPHFHVYSARPVRGRGRAITGQTLQTITDVRRDTACVNIAQAHEHIGVHAT
jgi:hypothetical protein